MDRFRKSNRFSRMLVTRLWMRWKPWGRGGVKFKGESDEKRETIVEKQPQNKF